MKRLLIGALLTLSTASFAQVWKTLPKGVRIIGYRNVQTSKINSNFNQFRSEANLGASFKIDAAMINGMTGNLINPENGSGSSALSELMVGSYKVNAEAQAQVHGTGFGYGISDRLMFYGEIAYYNAQVKSNIKQTQGNNYEDIARRLEGEGGSGGVLGANVRNLINVNESNIQNVITKTYGYKPIGDWYGSGYGDMETGVMYKAIERGTWGLLLYPGVVLPTGRQDDPDILQDMGFGDGQFDFFSELATGYIVNDKLAFGTTLRYTYQAATNKTLRVPTAQDFTLSAEKGNFDVKYGDRVNWMVNSTLSVNDWISFTPIYRFMYQLPSTYESRYTAANKFLGNGSDKQEHQVQLTTSFSTITPFLKKQFVLPAQINVNVLQTIAGKNVPKAGRFEVELRMLF